MPAGIEKSRAFNAGLPRARFQIFQLGERLLQIFFGAENSDEALHHLLQITVNSVRTLGTGIGKRSKELFFGFRDLRVRNSGMGNTLRMIRSRHASAAAKDQEI